MLNHKAMIPCLVERDGSEQNILLNVRDANILRLQFETLTEENQLLKKSKALYELKAWKEIERLQSELDRSSAEHKALQERCRSLEQYQKTQIDALLELENAVALWDSKKADETPQQNNTGIQEVSRDTIKNGQPDRCAPSLQKKSPTVISSPVTTTSEAPRPSPDPKPLKPDHKSKTLAESVAVGSVNPEIEQGIKRKSISTPWEVRKKSKTTQRDRVLDTLRSLPEGKGTSTDIYDIMSRTEKIDIHSVRTYTSWLCKHNIVTKYSRINKRFVWKVNEEFVVKNPKKLEEGNDKAAQSDETSVPEMPSLERDRRGDVKSSPNIHPEVADPSPKAGQLAGSGKTWDSFLEEQSQFEPSFENVVPTF